MFVSVQPANKAPSSEGPGRAAACLCVDWFGACLCHCCIWYVSGVDALQLFSFICTEFYSWRFLLYRLWIPFHFWFSQIPYRIYQTMSKSIIRREVEEPGLEFPICEMKIFSYCPLLSKEC